MNEKSRFFFKKVLKLKTKDPGVLKNEKGEEKMQNLLKRNPDAKEWKNFTLIELLVVIAIITIR